MAEKNGSKAVIIGGTHGMGLATAQHLISKGATVLITGRNPENLEPAKEKLGPNAIVESCDITSHKAIATLSQTIISKFGPKESIDLLFINAGYARLEPFTSVTEESFNRTMSTNVFGAFFSAQILAPLVKPGGSIVFTTAVANRRGIPLMSVYGASKAAVHSLTQTLAAELAPRNVRVNSVSPGFIRTPTMGVVETGKDELAEFEKLGASVTPLGRIGTSEEVARAVVWLGFEGTFSTGSELVVDGGLLNVDKAVH